MVEMCSFPNNTLPSVQQPTRLVQHGKQIGHLFYAAFKDLRKSIFQSRNRFPHGSAELDRSRKSSCERQNRQEPGPLGGPRTGSHHPGWQAPPPENEAVSLPLQAQG